jgi:hypothetical protein
MKVNVLGTEYEISINGNDAHFKHGIDGYCDETTKKIVIDEMIPDEMSKGDLKDFQNKVIRHELIHAFLFESGLAECSEWATNEEMIDFFAKQFPKIQKVFEELKII